MSNTIKPEFIDLSKPLEKPSIDSEVEQLALEKRMHRGISRRSFLGAVGTTAAITSMSSSAFARNFEIWPDEPVRYPTPTVKPLDPRFKYKLGNAPIMRMYRGTLWAEGCAWNGVGRYLLWSDIPGNEQLRWLEEDGHVSRQFRYPSGNSNGNTFDFQGRQISCEHDTHSLVRYGYDGKREVLADKSPEGNPLNAPNDAVVHPNDGAIWFTDPGYGGLMNYEGRRENTGSPQPLQKESVYRLATDGTLTRVADEPFKPNGLCFSNDYKKLYVADTGASHYGDAKNIIWQYDISDDGTKLSGARTFADMTYDGRSGFADGIRCDEDGNIWSSAGWVGDGYDGVHIFSPEGDRIGIIEMPEIVSNVCFGGSKRNLLFMTGSQSLYATYVETTGAHIT